MRLARGTAIAVMALAGAGAGTSVGIAQADTAPRTPAAAVAANPCDWNPSTNGSGSMLTNKPIYLRTGPGSGCDTIGWSSMPTNQLLWARCKYVNAAKNTWYYVRPEPPAGQDWDPGWVWSGNVKNVSSGIRTC